MNRILVGVLSLFCAASFASAQSNTAAVYDDFSTPEPANESTAANAPTASPVEAPANEATPAPVNLVEPNQTGTIEQASAPADTTPTPVVKKKGLPRTGLGLRAGIALGRLWGFDDLESNVDEPFGFGFEFGAQVRVEVSDVLHFTPEFTYSSLTTDHKDDDEIKRVYKQSYIDIDLLMRIFIASEFHLITGIQLSLNIGSDVSVGEEDIYVPGVGSFKNDYKENIEQSNVEFGLNFGLGYNLFERLSIDFRWYLGLTELYPEVKYIGDPEEDIDFDNDKWSLMNLSGAHTMKFKLGINFWII